MSDFTIRLIFNLKTGKTDVHVDMESTSDALPVEHEKEHRDVVEAILGKGILKPDDLGEVVVGRGRTAPTREPGTSEELKEPPEAMGTQQ